jgi:pentatricopeptide repeat protein
MGFLQVCIWIAFLWFVRWRYLYVRRKKTDTKNSLVGATVYNAYLDGLLKARCTEKAVEVYQRMKKERCRTNTETYTLMINVYGKVSHFAFNVQR